MRTTLDAVKLILPATNLTDDQINAAIDAATCVIDQVAISDCGSFLSEDCLLQAETYLSAHFASVTDNALSLTSETDGCGGKVTYGFKSSEGIKGTPFGQMANTLTCGCLAEFDKQPVGLFSIGTHGDDSGHPII